MWYLYIALLVYALSMGFAFYFACSIGHLKNQWRDIRQYSLSSIVFSLFWIITVPLVMYLRMKATRQKNKNDKDSNGFYGGISGQ